MPTAPPAPPAAASDAATTARTGRAVLAAGAVLFLVAAVLGWHHLRDGFGFHDEGMYMTDAWRLTAGDRLFPDSYPSVLRLSVVLNAAVFRVAPHITLLGFRELQYVLALLAVAAVGLAARRWVGGGWWLPLVLSLFAYTGLQVQGTARNLSYHTYPHLFFALYFAALLVALTCTGVAARRVWLLAAGVFLWAAGVALLPLAAGAVAPVACWLLGRWLRVAGPRLGAADVAWVLLPVAGLWLALLALWGGDLPRAVLAMWGYMRSHTPRTAFLDPPAWGYVAAALAFLVAARYAVRLRPAAAVVAIAALGAVLFWSVGTNLGGLLPVYWWRPFSRPMWLAALLIAGIVLFFAGAGLERRRHGGCTVHAGLPFLVLTQAPILGLLIGHFSASRLLAFTYLAIPAAVALSAHLLKGLPEGAGPAARAGFLAALLLPVYGWTAWSDWRFTYFDRPPETLTETIPDGFARGIATNPMYAAMIRWITGTAARYAGPGDYAIFLDRVPMGHMLTGLRPALNHSWLDSSWPLALRADAVAQMERDGRFPKVAYRFVRSPMYLPLPDAPGRYVVGGQVPYAPGDPVSGYLATRMRHVQDFHVNGEPWIELYVAPESPSFPSPSTQGGN
jgi:hypothetical protein